MEGVRVYLESFGCSTNLADGEVLAGCLIKAGYKLVGNVADANLVIYNTCAVKGPTENRIIEALKRVPKEKRVIVAGCLPLINFQRLCKEARFEGVVGPAAGDKIVGVAERVLRGEKVLALEDTQNAKPSLNLPRVRLNPVVGIIPISYGCLGSCAYCCVVFARGRLRSYTISEIVDRVKKDLDADVREFWLTSQDSACYGRDIGASLPQLLEAICSVEGDFKVRVGMMTPNMTLNLLDGLVHAFRSDKIFKFVHLPVQSGDDQILKSMRRFYSIADFKRIVDAFRAKFPKVTVATDFICGFPGETEEAFERTLKLIEDVKPDIVNISKFFARPKTPAAEMADSVPFSKVKERSSVLARVAKEIALERNQSWVGWAGEILVDEVGRVEGSWVGRNFAYKPVVIKCEENLLGKTVRVQIIEAFSTHLKGKLVN